MSISEDFLSAAVPKLRWLVSVMLADVQIIKAQKLKNNNLLFISSRFN